MSKRSEGRVEMYVNPYLLIGILKSMSSSINNEYCISAFFQAGCGSRAAPYFQ